MANSNQDFVLKGRGEPREGLRDQGVVHLSLAERYAGPLGEHGYA